MFRTPCFPTLLIYCGCPSLRVVPRRFPLPKHQPELLGNTPPRNFNPESYPFDQAEFFFFILRLPTPHFFFIFQFNRTSRPPLESLCLFPPRLLSYPRLPASPRYEFHRLLRSSLHFHPLVSPPLTRMAPQNPKIHTPMSPSSSLILLLLLLAAPMTSFLLSSVPKLLPAPSPSPWTLLDSPRIAFPSILFQDSYGSCLSIRVFCLPP